MNPNYPTLRTVPETTYFFLSAMCTPDFRWVLDNIYHTTDYQKYGQKQFPEVLPPDVKIPIVQSIPTSTVNRPAKYSCVIISHYHTEDLRKILNYVCDHEFDELKEYHEHLNEIATQDYLQNYK